MNLSSLLAKGFPVRVSVDGLREGDRELFTHGWLVRGSAVGAPTSKGWPGVWGEGLLPGKGWPQASRGCALSKQRSYLLKLQIF